MTIVFPKHLTTDPKTVFARVLIVAIIAIFQSGCFKPNNTFEGLAPQNPNVSPEVPSQSSKAQAREISSAVQDTSTTSRAFEVSSSFGDKNPSSMQKTTSGKYKVYLSVQGIKNSNPNVRQNK